MEKNSIDIDSISEAISDGILSDLQEAGKVDLDIGAINAITRYRVDQAFKKAFPTLKPLEKSDTDIDYTDYKAPEAVGVTVKDTFGVAPDIMIRDIDKSRLQGRDKALLNIIEEKVNGGY